VVAKEFPVGRAGSVVSSPTVDDDPEHPAAETMAKRIAALSEGGAVRIDAA
jgi:hypothetical protein